MINCNPHICGRITDMFSTSLPSRACTRMYSENMTIRLGSPQKRAAMILIFTQDSVGWSNDLALSD